MSEELRSRPRRVGHKGAAHIEPGNTLASFDAALRHDVDMIELDVLSEHTDGSGSLLVAHDYEDMRSRVPAQPSRRRSSTSPGRASPGIELDVDVKLPGYELRVLDALREFELIERTLISGMFTDGLAQIRAPSRRCAWAGRCRGCAATTPPTCSPRCPALAILTGYRAMLPRRARAALRRGPLRRDHGPLAGGHPGARAGGRRGRRRAVRVDGRRRAPDRAS